MEFGQGDCHGFVKTMSFRGRGCESSTFRPLADDFRHILPGDNGPEAALASE